MYQDDGDAPVGSVLVHPNGAETCWDIVNDIGFQLLAEEERKSKGKLFRKKKRKR